MQPYRASADTVESGLSRSAGQVKAAAACGLVPFIISRGHDPDRILGEAGLNERVFDDPDAAIPLSSYVAMMEQAAQQTGDTMFGLQFGLQFPPAAHGLIGELALAAPSIGAALKAFMDFFPLHQNDTQTACVHEASQLRLEYRILDAGIWARRQDAELTIGMFANLLQHAFGAALAVEEVSFEHPAGAPLRDYERAFAAPVYFGAGTNAITISAHGLARPMPGADTRTFAALAERLHRDHRGTQHASIKARVCGEIRKLLPEGYPPIEIVAESLNLARWTLQRRLAEHNVTFTECVDLVRNRLATLYLAEPHVSISHISDLLGYSEISAFSRAFRRWHGIAPEPYRKSNKQRLQRQG
jgi:AraC-like DNA-binding protein